MNVTTEQARVLADVICDTALLNTTLRDLFAAFALQGIVSRGTPLPSPDYVAQMAYQTADAMLAQRTALVQKES